MEYLRKPEWLKIKYGASQCGRTSQILEANHLNSVCTEAGCPNRGECFKNGTATFMLLGKNCTRNCTFCKVTKAPPEPVDEQEPRNLANAVKQMRLAHVVITSVTRDDLPDGGAGHFARTIEAIRKNTPEVTIEVLIPDFEGKLEPLRTVVEAEPDILNHNVETVPDLYSKVRPMAVFKRSMELLIRAKELGKGICTKSGFMLGLGENELQVYDLLKVLRNAECDMVTMGQYLMPSLKHYPVQEYVHPDQFEKYRQMALDLGIPCAVSGPLVRSSYHAKEDYWKLRQLKNKSIL